MAAVLHVITGLDRGGAELQLLRTAAVLQESGPQTVLSLRPAGEVSSGLREAGCEVWSANLSGRSLPKAAAVTAMISKLRRREFDAVFGWLYHGMTASFLLSALTRPAPRLVWMVRSSLEAYKGMSSASRMNVRIARKLSSKPQAIVYNSHRAAGEHAAFGFDASRAMVIHNGIDPTRYRFDDGTRKEARRKLDVPEDEILVGLIARYHPVKDHRTFVAAAATVANAHRHVRFVLVGKGCDRSNRELAALLSEAGVSERFILAGERSNVSDILPALDVAASSSLSEGFSNTIAEAMMSEVPCVATDVGDSALIVGRCGHLVPAASAGAFARALLTLIELGAGGRRQLGAEARGHILRHFSTDAADEKVATLLSRLMAQTAKH